MTFPILFFIVAITIILTYLFISNGGLSIIKYKFREWNKPKPNENDWPF